MWRPGIRVGREKRKGEGRRYDGKSKRGNNRLCSESFICCLLQVVLNWGATFVTP